MASRIDASDPAIQQAIDDVKKPNGSTRWILLDYVAKSDNKLKFVDSGTGGIEEIQEYLNDGKILFFLVWFEINHVRKFAYISWCGEGVTGMKKGLFNNHAQDVSFLFKGFHAQINARSDKDVKEKIIVDRLTTATGANYDSGAKIQGSAKLVPQSVAQGRNQATQSNAKVRTFEKAQGTDQSTENRPASSSITYESRQLDQSTESKPIASAIRYESRGQDQSTESTPQKSTLPGTRAPGGAPAPSGNASSFKARFEQAAQGSSSAPARPPPNKVSAPPPTKSAPPPSRPAPAQPPPKQPEPEPEPEPEPVQEEYPADTGGEQNYEEQNYGGEQNYEEQNYGGEEQNYGGEEQNYGGEQQNYEDQNYGGEQQSYDQSYDQSAPASSGGVLAKALYDYDAENADDLSFKEGDMISVLDQSDPSGWWEGELNGKTGFFPSNFVELA